MKRWFAGLPLHRKLMALAFGVSAVALVAAIAGLALFDVARFRTAAAGDAHALAQVLAENTAAALVFDDADAAAATLGSVRVRPTVVLACVYRADGTPLAWFAQARRADPCPPRPADRETWTSVASTAPVERNGNVVGTVYVERDLSDLGNRMIATAGSGVLVLLFGAGIAFVLARLLQGTISRPIVGLAQAARGVGRDGSYVMPAIDAPPDEVGELVRAFDDMVRRVGDTTSALMSSNEALRREVEQRERMQVEREALLASEREASRLKDEFLAAVSHELRTPLNAILGWTQILQARPPSPETLERGIASLARNAQAQNRVIQDLLDISRIITGKLQLAMHPVDLREVVQTSIEVVDPLAVSRKVDVQAVLPDEPCLVHGDYDRLRQVVWNLLSNALKVTPAGGRVDVRLEHRDAQCTLTVVDTGVGIPLAFLPHVFERFRQADGSTTREQGGLGLGLAIVKELTDLHGGTVRAESDGPGRGARFTVSLPAATSMPQPDAAHVNEGTGPRLDGLRVLVVDDNADAVDVLKMALDRAGARVSTALSGEEAVSAWVASPFDVLVCDLGMPGTDGFEVLRRIRAIDSAAGRTTRALAVTAYASDDYRVRCLHAGFSGHLSKPYSLVDAVQAVMDTAGVLEK